MQKMGLKMNLNKRSRVFEGQILNFFMFQLSYPEVLIALTLPKKNFIYECEVNCFKLAKISLDVAFTNKKNICQLETVHLTDKKPFRQFLNLF